MTAAVAGRHHLQENIGFTFSGTSLKWRNKKSSSSSSQNL